VVLSFGPALRPNSLRASLKTLGQKTGPYDAHENVFRLSIKHLSLFVFIILENFFIRGCVLSSNVIVILHFVYHIYWYNLKKTNILYFSLSLLTITNTSIKTSFHDDLLCRL